MTRIFIILIVTIILFEQSCAQNKINQFENSIIPENSDEKQNIYERMDYYGVPGVSIAVIKDGQISWAKGYGLIQKGKKDLVDTETVFSVGSVSKIGTAVAVLRLVDQNSLKLDEDVNTYISKWKVPNNKYTENSPVTIRRILSHTAGLTIHGFADFLPNEELPNTVDILRGDHPAKNSPVMVNIPVGSRYRYSGGGTQVLQLVVEETSDLPFADATSELVFKPLAMKHSTYQNPLPDSYGNIASAHDYNGNPVALPRGFQSFPEMAASGLWTTPTDVARMIITLMNSYHGLSEDFLSQSLTLDMMTMVPPSDYGLGPRLSVNENEVIFSHNGANDSYRAYFRGYLEGKDGFVILTNGNRGLDLISEVCEALIISEDF